jgi:hypothetical protein
MTSRIFAASIALLGIGAIVAPVETSAGSGGIVAAPSLSARGAIRSFVGAPPAARTSLPPGMTRALPAHIRDFRMLRLGDHREPDFPLCGATRPMSRIIIHPNMGFRMRYPNTLTRRPKIFPSGPGRS